MAIRDKVVKTERVTSSDARFLCLGYIRLNILHLSPNMRKITKPVISKVYILTTSLFVLKKHFDENDRKLVYVILYIHTIVSQIRSQGKYTLHKRVFYKFPICFQKALKIQLLTAFTGNFFLNHFVILKWNTKKSKETTKLICVLWNIKN